MTLHICWCCGPAVGTFAAESDGGGRYGAADSMIVLRMVLCFASACEGCVVLSSIWLEMVLYNGIGYLKYM